MLTLDPNPSQHELKFSRIQLYFETESVKIKIMIYISKKQATTGMKKPYRGDVLHQVGIITNELEFVLS